MYTPPNGSNSSFRFDLAAKTGSRARDPPDEIYKKDRDVRWMTFRSLVKSDEYDEVIYRERKREKEKKREKKWKREKEKERQRGGGKKTNTSI